MLFKRNVKLQYFPDPSPWRKTSIGAWRNSNEASIYSRLDIDATGILKKMSQMKEQGHIVSTTAIIGKAIATALHSYPLINSVIRFGRIYQRQEVNVFFQVTAGKKSDEISGVIIKNCDTLSVDDICSQLRELSLEVRRQQDPDSKNRKLLGKLIPGFLVGAFLRLTSFIAYTLNLKTPLYHHHDYFGSAMVTALSMFGIENAFVPLIPFTRCPLILAVGKIQEKVVVDINHAIAVKPMLEICVTLDHRLVDAYGAAKLMKSFKRYLANPD